MQAAHEKSRVFPSVAEGYLWIACSILLLLDIGIRALRYALVAPPVWLDESLGVVLVLHFKALTHFHRNTPLVGIIVLLLAIWMGAAWWEGRRQAVGTSKHWRWGSRAVWVLLALFGSLLLDAHPQMTGLYVLTLGVAATAWRWRALLEGGRLRYVPAIGVAGAAGIWLMSAWTLLEVMAVLAWVLLAAAFVVWALPRLRLGDAVAALLTLAILHQIVLASVLRRGANDARLSVLGPESAYSFCQIPGTQRLFAAIVSCTEEPEECRNDTIVEYDARRLSFVRRHIPFDDAFFGRMLHLVCLENSLLVGMSFIKDHGTWHRENVMEVDVGGSGVTHKTLVGHSAGHRILLDQERRDAFVVSEYSNVVLRLPLGSDTRKLGGFAIASSPVQSFLGWDTGSLQTEVFATRKKRGTGFFAEWVGGTRISEVNLASGKVVATYQTNNGGVHSIAIDEENERLVATGLWGIDVIDLRSGRAVFRVRTEFGPRLPLIDSRRNLVYVTTTYGNHVWIFDRRRFTLLGKLTVGPGARNGLITNDGAYLVTSGGNRQVAWDLEKVVASLEDKLPR